MGCHHGHGPCLELPSILWLSSINECWKRLRSHIVTFFGYDFVSHMTYLQISPQGKAQYELSYHGNLRQTVEYKNHTYRKIVIMYKNPHSNLPNDRQWVCAQWVVQYIPRNMHTVFALLCFVVVIHWLIFPYPSGLLHWHCGNLTIAPVPAKQPWWIWINTSCEFTMNDCITTTKQSTTKPCAYFLGYTVSCRSIGFTPHLFNNYTDQKVLGQLWLPRLWLFCILWWYSAEHW